MAPNLLTYIIENKFSDALWARVEALPDMDSDDLFLILKLIVWAREEAVIDACESCDRIDPDNPPESGRDPD